jgi:hypothetical protein
MTRDFLMATIAALGLTACGPDLSTDAGSSAAANDPAVARVEKPEPGPGPSAADEPKEGETKKEDGEKAPR